MYGTYDSSELVVPIDINVYPLYVFTWHGYLFMYSHELVIFGFYNQTKLIQDVLHYEWCHDVGDKNGT